MKGCLREVAGTSYRLGRCRKSAEVSPLEAVSLALIHVARGDVPTPLWEAGPLCSGRVLIELPTARREGTCVDRGCSQCLNNNTLLPTVQLRCDASRTRSLHQ